jgi:hypothetical protein
VTAFTEEYPDAIVTVVVDATFGHRIDKSELAEFDAAVAHNELVAPPAGAIGRGDAFVLSIANKVGARILSNDSFQEFHGEYSWLFDEGRLIGGKPVPFVGWVFVERLPVKGPVSRKATRAARGGGGGRDARPSRRQASKEASLPMPVPTTPPPGARRSRERAADRPVETTAIDEATVPAEERPAARAPVTGGEPVNDLLPFLDFVEHHPIGSSVNGVVESYSSHGAYVTIGDVRGYVPLRLMGDPPPRSAREVMKLGDAATLVVTSFAPARRSIDLAIPKAAPVTDVVASPPLEEIAGTVAPARPSRKRVAKAAAPTAPEPVLEAVDAAVAEAALEAVAAAAEPAARPSRKRAAKKAAAAAAVAAHAEPEAVAPAPAPAAPAPKKAPARRATKKGAAVVAAEPTPAAEAPEPVAPAKKAPAPKKAPAKKASAKQAPTKKAAAKKVAAKKAPAKKAAAKKAPAKKAAAVAPTEADG